MKRVRAQLAPFLVALGLSCGCAASGAPHPGRAGMVPPLTEAEFDQFATRLAGRLSAAIEQRGYRPPVTIAPPSLTDQGIERRDLAARFARRLTAGLNDRLGGAVVFRPSAVAGPRLRCALDFSARSRDYLERRVTFAVRDTQDGQELLRESFDYRLAPRRRPGVARRPAKRKIKLDRPARGLGAFVQQQLPFYRDYTISGPAGAVVFVDRKAWERFWLKAQACLRTEDGRLRVELDMRSRGRRRTVELRVIFLDARGQQAGVTPRLPYRLLPYYTKKIVVTAGDRRATRYICLIDD